jgi:hypothetical protein
LPIVELPLAINPLKTEAQLNTHYLKIQFPPQRKHNATLININLLMMFMEIIAVYFENHTKPINILCEQNADLLNVKVGGTYNYQCTLNG